MINSTTAPTSHWEAFFSITPLVTLFMLVALALFIAVAPFSWLLIVVAATTGAVLTLRFPWLAWIAFAFALPIASSLRIGPASLTDLLLAASLGIWFAAVVCQRRSLHAPRLPLWPLFLYLLALYISSLIAANLGEALTEMVKWLEFGALLVIVPLAIPVRFLPWLVAAMLAAAALQGIYGLYQFIFRIGPDWFLISGGYMRASGSFGQPNPFGAYMGLSLPVAFSLTLWGMTSIWRNRNIAAWLWTLFYLLAVICIGLGLVASWSRGGWFGAIGGIVVVLAFFDRRSAMLLALGLLLVLMAALVGSLNPHWVPAAITARIGNLPAYLGFVDIVHLEVNDDNLAIIERVAHWLAALRMWELSPWLGVGPGNYATAYPAVALPLWQDPLGHAHNIYLNVLAESGLIGFSAFLLFWSSLIGWLLLQMRKVLRPHSWSRALAVGVMGVIVHLAIHSFFDNLFVQGMYLHVAMWIAVVAAATNVAGDSNSLVAPYLPV